MSRGKCGFLGSLIVLGCLKMGWSAPPPGLWDGGGINNSWSTAANWADNLAPTHDGTAAITMAGTVQLLPFADSPWSIASLTFDNTAGAFTLTGFPLSIERFGIVNNSVNGQTINAPIDLRASQSWTAAAGPMIFGAGINNLGRNLTITGGSNTTLRSVLSGSGTLSKTGNGTLILGSGSGDVSANTYTGLTTISSGAMTLDKAAGIVAIPGDLQSNGGSITANRSGQISSSSNV